MITCEIKYQRDISTAHYVLYSIPYIFSKTMLYEHKVKQCEMQCVITLLSQYLHM